MPTRSSTTRSRKDPVLAALKELSDVLEANAADQRVLARRIKSATQARATGKSWTEILERESEPGTIRLVTDILGRMSAVSGVLRRALAVSLREDGLTIPAIAGMFGVTHQRVSSLLRRPGS
jgi:hypothetical protein